MASTPDRRRVLALTGALLAGLAGCASDDGDGGGTGTRMPTDTETPADTETPTDTGGGNPDAFPRLDLTTDPEIDEELLAEQVRGNLAFAFDLLDVLRAEQPDANLFCSPYSVSVALAMTYAGARAETAEEMAQALHYELGQDDLHPAFGALEAELARRNEDGKGMEGPTDDEDAGPAFELRTANTTWGQKGYPFREDLLDLLEAYYGAGMQLVDFQGSPEEARQRINDWVAERTNDRIEDLLLQGSISSTTRLVLTNAVYFVGMWKFPFEEEQTEPGAFTALDGTELEVSMMHASMEVPYAEVDGHHLVELPYANGDTSMVIVVPAAGEFEAVEASLSVDRLATLLDAMSTPQVDLALPKFAVESKFSLVEAMRALGMERAFTGDADFSGMAEGGSLFVSEIVHQAFVEVDERGTEAAAATAVVIDESAAAERVELSVGRPFLFYIRDRPTETPLFLGRVVVAPGGG
jgi:serpin B